MCTLNSKRWFTTSSSGHCHKWLHHRPLKTISRLADVLLVHRWQQVSNNTENSDYIRLHFSYNSIHQRLFESGWNSFLTNGACIQYFVGFSVMSYSLSAWNFWQVLWTAEHKTCRNRLSWQIQRDMECPFTGVTNYGRVCRMGARKQVLELVCTVYTWTNWHVYSDICVYFQRVSRVVACAPRDIYVSAVCRQTTGLYAHRMCLFVVYTQRNGCICGMYTDKCVYLCCVHREMGVFVVCTQTNVYICGMYTDKCVYLWYVHRQMCIFVLFTSSLYACRTVFNCSVYSEQCICCLYAENWLRELSAWCPALGVIVYYGSQEERRVTRHSIMYGGRDDFHVLLTTWVMLWSHSRLLLHCAGGDGPGLGSWQLTVSSRSTWITQLHCWSVFWMFLSKAIEVFACDACCGMMCFSYNIPIWGWGWGVS